MTMPLVLDLRNPGRGLASDNQNNGFAGFLGFRCNQFKGHFHISKRQRNRLHSQIGKFCLLIRCPGRLLLNLIRTAEDRR